MTDDHDEHLKLHSQAFGITIPIDRDKGVAESWREVRPAKWKWPFYWMTFRRVPIRRVNDFLEWEKMIVASKKETELMRDLMLQALCKFNGWQVPADKS